MENSWRWHPLALYLNQPVEISETSPPEVAGKGNNGGWRPVNLYPPLTYPHPKNSRPYDQGLLYNHWLPLNKAGKKKQLICRLGGGLVDQPWYGNIFGCDPPPRRPAVCEGLVWKPRTWKWKYWKRSLFLRGGHTQGICTKDMIHIYLSIHVIHHVISDRCRRWCTWFQHHTHFIYHMLHIHHSITHQTYIVYCMEGFHWMPTWLLNLPWVSSIKRKMMEGTPTWKCALLWWFITTNESMKCLTFVEKALGPAMPVSPRRH